MKLHERLFQLLIFFLPSQLGLHFWPTWSFVRGLRVDYLAPTIYFTDLLLLATILFWLLESKPDFKFSPKQLFSAILVLSFFVLNLVFAVTPLVAFIKIVRLTELLLFYYYLICNPQSLKLIFKPLSLAVIYTFMLSVFQLYFQKTIGGPFYWLGERTFDASTPAIAEFTFLGREYLRPYATFSHPNTLAGFMLVSALLLFPSLLSLLAFLLVLISFSQNAWLAVAILLSISVIKVNKSFTRFFIFVTFMVSFIFPFTPYLLGAKRQALSFEAFRLFSHAPIFGIGQGNYIPAAVTFQNSFLLQPVHNIYLLILVEAGTLGLLLTYYFLNKIKLTLPLIAILLTGIFDHYWLTQTQTQLLLVLVLAFAKLNKTWIKN